MQTNAEIEALALELLDHAPANVEDYVLDTLAKWERNPDRTDLVTGYARRAVEQGLEKPRYVVGKCPRCGSWTHFGYSREDLARTYSDARIELALAEVADAPVCELGGTTYDDAYGVLSSQDELAWMRRYER